MIQIDMEMPKACCYCEFSSCKGWSHYCDVTLEDVDMDSEERPKDCPLKEVPSGIATKQLEDMYDSYEKSLWREHEDVRGDDMVDMGAALQLLQEELCLLGCWDDDVIEEQQGENK